VWVKSLEQTFIDPNKSKIQIVSPFESGYLDSGIIGKMKEVSTYISFSYRPYFAECISKPIVGEFIMKDTIRFGIGFNQEIAPTK
jgi:hypothetical protein